MAVDGPSHATDGAQRTLWQLESMRAAGRDVRGAGTESRFADGLESPGASPRSLFYEPEYHCDVGTLAFCRGLPGSDVVSGFLPEPIFELCVDAVLKLDELGRQRLSLSPLHVLPIFVYTYELSGGCQIYSSMNRAMRNNEEEAIVFWRPLIWQVGPTWRPDSSIDQVAK